MTHAFVQAFGHIPPVLAVLIMSVLPILERFALSVAIFGYHLPVIHAILLVILGNMVPVLLILSLAEKFHAWISKHSFFGKAWVKSVAHAQAKFAKYEKYGLVGLLLFLSIPSPLNGAFTASLIAFILGYPMRKSLPYLFAGVVIGNFLTLALISGAVKIF